MTTVTPAAIDTRVAEKTHSRDPHGPWTRSAPPRHRARARDEAGPSPGCWPAEQRLDLAKHLLEGSDLPVDRIAERAGFGTGASLRLHIQQALGVTPSAYRRTFRGTT